MNEHEHEPFEAELRRLKPAAPPADLMSRLAAIRPAAPQTPEPPIAAFVPPSPWRLLLRWLAPAAALGAITLAVLVWRPVRPAPQPQATSQTAPAKAPLKADDVEIDQELVASFDAVARLPNGLPVRFRCRQWADEVVLRDTARAVVIEERVPRLEVVPISFETY